jgi:ATP adenylyltransferase
MENKNIWAPWRTAYLENLDKNDSSGKPAPCFLCRYWEQPDQDVHNLVVWRTGNAMALLNRYPYTGGHLLIAPRVHAPDLAGLEESTLLSIMRLARDAQRLLAEILKPHGFNLGVNIGRCAGAGLPDHVHMHLVPRWSGDTNFMDVVGEIRVISLDLNDLYQKMAAVSKSLNLPQS